MALDAKMRIKEARKLRFAQYDTKRKNLVEELEERERAFKKAKLDKEEKQKSVWRENERIMEEGRLMREKRAKEFQDREEEATKARERERAELEPPKLGEFPLALFIDQSHFDVCCRHTRYDYPRQVLPRLAP